MATVLNSAHLLRIPIDEHLGLQLQSSSLFAGGVNAVAKDDTSLCSAESDVEGGGLWFKSLIFVRRAEENGLQNRRIHDPRSNSCLSRDWAADLLQRISVEKSGHPRV